MEAAETIGFAEAAAHLGISESTLKTVLDRGFLKGVRDASGEWRIYLAPLLGESGKPGGFQSQSVESAAPASEAGGATADAARSGAPRASASGAPPSFSPIENVLAEEIQYLRQQIEQRDEVIAKKDQLIDELVRHLIKLDRGDAPAPVVAPFRPLAGGAEIPPRPAGGSEADRWHNELDRAFQELRGLLARRPKRMG